MQKVTSNRGSESTPLAEYEFFVPSIEKSDNVFRSGFVVKESRAQWSEIGSQVVWEEPEWER
jgi:hypothetical protein